MHPYQQLNPLKPCFLSNLWLNLWLLYVFWLLFTFWRFRFKWVLIFILSELHWRLLGRIWVNQPKLRLLFAHLEPLRWIGSHRDHHVYFLPNSGDGVSNFKSVNAALPFAWNHMFELFDWCVFILCLNVRGELRFFAVWCRTIQCRDRLQWHFCGFLRNRSLHRRMRLTWDSCSLERSLRYDVCCALLFTLEYQKLLVNFEQLLIEIVLLLLSLLACFPSCFLVGQVDVFLNDFVAQMISTRELESTGLHLRHKLILNAFFSCTAGGEGRRILTESIYEMLLDVACVVVVGAGSSWVLLDPSRWIYPSYSLSLVIVLRWWV